MPESVQECLARDDPLSREIAEFLVNYSEEDGCVDYKLTIDPASEREWLELTKDISAFANTLGGYLVFGVRNRDKELIGLHTELVSLLEDANNILQKINRHVEPSIEYLRSKAFDIGGVLVVVLLVPQSKGRTHLIAKDGGFTHQSGKKQILLRKGTFYIRRSAGNHLGDSRDLDAVVERRIDQFRASLMEKIVKVVSASEGSEVFVLSRDPEDQEGKRFRIEDAPDSIPIRGMSFSVEPQGVEEEVAAWVVLSAKSVHIHPPPFEVWKWYSTREGCELSLKHNLAVFQFSLWGHVPPFFWIQGLRAQDIQPALLEAIRRRPPGADVSNMLVVSSFLGKTFYQKALSALGEYRTRLSPRQLRFPTEGPRREFGFVKLGAHEDIKSRKVKELAALNNIVKEALAKGRPPGTQERWDAQKKDCFLYAQDDMYTVSSAHDVYGAGST